MKELTTRQLRNRFKKMYKEEFEDPSESFMDFLLDLLPKEILIKMLDKGDKYYYSIFHKYK